MRVFLFVIAVVVLMALLGWISFGRNSDRAIISVETKTIESDLKKTAEAAQKAARQGLEKLDRSPNDRATWPSNDQEQE